VGGGIKHVKRAVASKLYSNQLSLNPSTTSSTELQAAERGIPYFLLRENARPSVARPRSSGADGSGIWVTWI
jgi:hypothetical protein